MTVSNETRAVRYLGDTSTTVWAYTFLIPTKAECEVSLYDTVAETWTDVDPADFSITGLNDPSGGTVTYPLSGSPLAATVYIYINRTVAYTQTLSIPSRSAFDATTLEAQLDDTVFQTQQNRDAAQGGLRLQAPDVFNDPLPPKESLAGKTIAFDSVTGEPEAGPTVTEISNAQDYAAAAAASATAAANTLINFETKYLGAKASDPTLDNEGNALIIGALYWNTTNDVMRVYNGTSWEDVSTAASLSDYTATGDGSTTTFATGNTLPDSPNNVFVWLDGVRQYPTSDYTLSGNSVVFTTAPYNGAAILIIGLNVVDIGTPSANSVGPDQIIDNSVGPDQLDDAQKPEIRGWLDLDLLRGYNRIINGDFDFWQRGNSQTSSGYGSADRWISSNTGTTKTASRQSFTPGQTDVPGNPNYWMRHVVTSSAGASNGCVLIQKIEQVRTFAGKKCTLTFYAKADSAKNIAVEFQQFYGTGGSPTAANTDHVETVSLTTAWQKISFTVDLTSLTGTTLGTDGNNYLQIGFWFDAGSDFNSRTNSLGNQSGTFDIAHVSLVEGDATDEDDPFSPRYIQQELALCQRYYEIGGIGAAGGWTTTAAQLGIKFTTTKRNSTPTLTLTTSAPQVSEPGVATRTASGSSIIVFNRTANSAFFQLDGFSGATAGNAAALRGDYITIDAEL